MKTTLNKETELEIILLCKKLKEMKDAVSDTDKCRHGSEATVYACNHAYLKLGDLERAERILTELTGE